MRLLSSFHLVIPILLIWGIRRLGYDRRALPLQVVSLWALLLISYFFAPPDMDINYVFGPFEKRQTSMPSGLYLLVCMATYPLLLNLPTHLLLSRYQRSRETGDHAGQCQRQPRT